MQSYKTLSETDSYTKSLQRNRYNETYSHKPVLHPNNKN